MKIHVHGIAMVFFLTATVLDARSAPVNSDEAAAKIDQLIAAKLVENKLTPNPVTPDDVFVRRLYLDLTGRIPTKRETLNFLESKDPDKRAALVDSLIGSEAFTCLLAGGGIKGGTLYGKTDERGAKILENPVTVTDFNATIGYALGLPLDQVLYSPSMRPFTVADKGKPVVELFG
jgi:hypothetical protein